MRNKIKKVGLAALIGLNLVGVSKMSTGNYQKLGNQFVEDPKNAKLAYYFGGGSFWQGAGAGAGGLIGGAIGTAITGGPWGGYFGIVLGAGAGAY